MKTQALKLIFVGLAAGIVGVVIVLAHVGLNQHLLLGAALAATALSIAADPDFILHDAREILHPSVRSSPLTFPIAARINLLLALVCLAAWLYQNVF